jgi:hypothetical protein
MKVYTAVVGLAVHPFLEVLVYQVEIRITVGAVPLEETVKMDNPGRRDLAAVVVREVLLVHLS